MIERKTRKQDFIPDEKIIYSINNIVATVTINVTEKINLLQILNNYSKSEYNPEVFPGLILRIEDPKATFLIFTSGKMILTGLSHLTDVEHAVNKMLKNLEKAGVRLKDPLIKVVNIVASGDLQLFIDLNKAAITLEKAMYEPEVFPALIYRMDEPKAVFLLFSNGKFICTKTIDEETLKIALNKLKNYLKELEVIADDNNASSQYEIYL